MASKTDRWSGGGFKSQDRISPRAPDTRTRYGPLQGGDPSRDLMFNHGGVLLWRTPSMEPKKLGPNLKPRSLIDPKKVKIIQQAYVAPEKYYGATVKRNVNIPVGGFNTPGYSESVARSLGTSGPYGSPYSRSYGGGLYGTRGSTLGGWGQAGGFGGHGPSPNR